MIQDSWVPNKIYHSDFKNIDNVFKTLNHKLYKKDNININMKSYFIN